MSDARSAGNARRTRNPAFDYLALRLLMGFIALLMPWVVYHIAGDPELESISASYHTDAQDIFVGMLFIVGAFLLAYRGTTRWQGFASKVGAAAAILVAIFPTSTSRLDLDSGGVHYAAALALFSVLAYFCYVFWTATKGGPVVEQRRGPYYLGCGIIMLASMSVIAVAKAVGVADELGITFWGEAIALTAFGVAWIIAGKAVPFLSVPKEQPELYSDIRDGLRKMVLLTSKWVEGMV